MTALRPLRDGGAEHEGERGGEEAKVEYPGMFPEEKEGVKGRKRKEAV